MNDEPRRDRYWQMLDFLDVGGQIFVLFLTTAQGMGVLTGLAGGMIVNMVLGRALGPCFSVAVALVLMVAGFLLPQRTAGRPRYLHLLLAVRYRLRRLRRAACRVESADLFDLPVLPTAPVRVYHDGRPAVLSDGLSDETAGGGRR